MKELQNCESKKLSEKMLQKTESNFWLEFYMLLVRSYRNSYRNPSHLQSRIVMLLMTTFLTYWVFYDPGYDYENSINKAGFIYYSCNSQITLNFFGTLLNIIAEKAILRKEYKSQTYGAAAIFFSRSVFELPIMIVLGLIF